jgi:hypothetical protein
MRRRTPAVAGSRALTFHRKVMAETRAILLRLHKVVRPDGLMFAMTETFLR